MPAVQDNDHGESDRAPAAPAGGNDHTERDDLDEDGSPEVGVPDRDGVLRALATGKGLRWVMDAYGLDYATAKALHNESRRHVAAR